MIYRSIRGLDKKVSAYVLGTANIVDESANAEDIKRLDDAFSMGINTFDSAPTYGYPDHMGATNIVLGKWMKARGNREDVVITTKCCHPSAFRNRVHDFDIEADLYDNLAQLQTDYVDVLLLHRDDIKTPVSEIMDTLNKHRDAGRIRAFGVANWGYERIKEANEYALSKGLQPFTVSEQHYSIAEQLGEPFVEGSGSLSGPRFKEARQFHIDMDIPVISYSCLSGGLLTGRISYEQFKTDPESIPYSIRNGYCYDINFKRLERTAELAKVKGLSIAQIGLAYAMSSDMTVMPIVGALTYDELASSIDALDVKLSKAECDWVDLSSDFRPY